MGTISLVSEVYSLPASVSVCGLHLNGLASPLMTKILGYLGGQLVNCQLVNVSSQLDAGHRLINIHARHNIQYFNIVL